MTKLLSENANSVVNVMPGTSELCLQTSLNGIIKTVNPIYVINIK